MSNHVQNAPNETVYARNLPYEITEDEVAKHFEPAGRPTRIAFSKDRETGRFKGIAFVTFPSVDIAESAVRNLNQVPLKGREIFLDFSRSDRGPRRDRGGGYERRDQRDMGPPHGDGGDLRYGGGGGGGGGPGPYGQPPPQQQQPQQQQQPYMQPYGGGPQGMPQMMPQPQGPHGQPVVYAPQGMPGQPQSSVVQQPTIILQADGRQVLLAPGQPLPAGLQQAGAPHMAAPQAAPGGGTLVQGPTMPQMGQAQPQGGPMQFAPQPVQVPQARPKAPHELPQDLPVGQVTAAHAGQRMADVLGDPQSAATPSQQQTSSAIASMSPKQLYQILKDLKSHIEADPQKGRDVLRQNLVLTKALFQAQILLGMLNPDATAEAPAAAEEAKPAAEPAPNGGPAVVAPAPQPAPANQQDMLRRVMALTPEAIAQLAPKDRAQVEAVREHIRVNNIQV